MTDDPQTNGGPGAEANRLASWAETMSTLDRRIEQDPQNADYWYHRAIAFRFLGDFVSATRDIEEALRLNPVSVRAHIERGNLLLDMGQHSAAISMYDKAIQLDPLNAHAYFHRGSAYAKLDQPAEATSYFTKAVELKPDWPSPYFSRAIARDDVEDFPGAISDYDAFLRLETKRSDLIGLAHGLRAFVCLKAGLYEEAIAGFDAKLRRFPNDAESYLYRSLARKKLGDSTGAAEDRERAIELDPDILGVA